jgi:cytochrome c-type biogenesis protein CcmH/NrfG
MSRLEEARKTLIVLAEHDQDGAFETWLEVADLDESFRKAHSDAVDAYRAASKLRPEHPLPQLSLVRLLRATKNHKRLVTELRALAKSEPEPRALSLVHAANRRG